MVINMEETRKEFLSDMQEMQCSDGSIRRTGGIGLENVVIPVKVFLGMEFGRYDGAEWGYVFGQNADGTCAILVPSNHTDEDDDEHAYAEIFTRCEWNERFNAYYAGGDCVDISDGNITYVYRKGE